MTVCLAMIVRDEADEIEACLLSALPLIDTWVVIDTGSTDDTPQLVEQTLAGLPGRLLHRPWVGFAHNRTELMREAFESADWLLLLDGDMVVHCPAGRLPDDLTEDVYHFRIEGPLDYALPMLVSGRLPWTYEGVAHSCLTLAGVDWSSAVLDEVTIEDHSDTGTEKMLADLELLRAAHAADPLDARSCFYLAQTYFYLDRFDEAIAAYRERVHLSGSLEETYYARFMLGALLCEHVSFAEGAPELVRAWAGRPNRVEALRALANSANGVADKQPYPTDVLFVHRNCYRLGIDPAKVSAVIVTRGDVDLEPILATLPYDDVIVWDNSKRAIDAKIYGRYLAMDECKHDVIYCQDDDVLFTAHDALCRHYEPGVIVANMDQGWIDACGYHDNVLIGAGSIADRAVYREAVARYLAAHPLDDDFLVEADFAVGVLAAGRKVDLGYEPRPFTDDPDRLYQQPGQTERKHAMLARARALRDQ